MFTYKPELAAVRLIKCLILIKNVFDFKRTSNPLFV